jgi:hypothetical protein
MKQQIGVAASGVGHRRKRDGVGRVATAYTTGTKSARHVETQSNIGSRRRALHLASVSIL